MESKMLELNYVGTCYWCERKKLKIHSKPVAGVRVCKNCLARVGQCILDTIGRAKDIGAFAEIKTSEVVVNVIRDIYKKELSAANS
jgi:hypothetical protein